METKAESAENVDVQRIMQEIRDEIKEKGYTDDVLPFSEIPIPDRETSVLEYGEDFDLKEYLKANMGINQTYNVSIWHQFMGNPVKRLLKKSTRKLIRPVIEPVINDQTSFNANTVRTLNQVRNYIVCKTNENEELSKKQRELELRISELEEENKRLKERVSKISQ